MIKTYNRRPLSVPTPSSSDVKEYYFNHYNFKGISDNKNVLSVDQESFEDCLNVYVDEQGMLKSRPTVKAVGNLKNIVKQWSFGDLTIYYAIDADGNNIINVNDYTYSIPTKVINVCKLQNYLLIFLENDLKAVRLDTFELIDGEGLIYSPEIIENGNYNKNLLTDKSKNVYQYSNDLRSELTSLINNTIYYNFNDGINSLKIDTLSNLDFLVQPYITDILTGSILAKTNINDKQVLINIYQFKELVCVVDGVRFTLPPIVQSAGLFDSTGVKYALSYDGLKLSATVYADEFTTDDKEVLRYTLYEINLEPNSEWTEILTDTLSYPVVPVLEIGQSLYVHHVEYKDSNHVRIRIADNTGPACVDILYINGTSYTWYDFGLYNVGKFSVGECDWIYAYLTMNSKGKIQAVFYPNTTDAPLRYNLYNVEENVKNYALRGAYVNFPNLINDWQNTEYVVIYDPYTKYDVWDSNFNNRVMASRTVHVRSNINGDAEIVSDLKWSVFNCNLIEIQRFKNYLDLLHIRTEFSAYGSLFDTKLKEIKNTYFSNLIYNVSGDKYIYHGSDVGIISNNIPNPIKIWTLTDGTSHIPYADHLLVDDKTLYLASGNTLYVSEYVEDDGVFKLYIPERNKNVFTDEITQLYQISDDYITVFFDDETYIASQTEITFTDDPITYIGYVYEKSKLPIGCKKGSNIITSFDGSYTIVPTRRGLAYLGYQQFVASTEQALSYVSDTIYSLWYEFGKEPVKLYKDSYYIYCYKETSTECFILDVRTNGWFRWLLPKQIASVQTVNDGPQLLLDGSLYKFNYDENDYYDVVNDNTSNIDWYIRSQKLYLNAFNYYKHINNITLTSVLDSDRPLTFDLQLINYRDKVDVSRTETVEYDVDTVRTFVQKLNYSKVIEFQYYLQNSNDYAIQVPLSLSNITIKYKIGGQVR